MINFITAYLHGCFNNHDGWVNSPYAIVLLIGGGFSLLIISVISGVMFFENEDWKKWVRWGTLVPLWFAWPYLLLAIVPAFVVWLGYLLYVSWADVVPSKEDRVAKAERKIRDLHGKIAGMS